MRARYTPFAVLASVVLLALGFGLLAFANAPSETIPESGTCCLEAPVNGQPGSYVGMWVTGDGYIRHELLPNGRYDEARGQRQSAYRGSYTIEGDHIEYLDDTGFTASGDFRDGVLYHGGYVFYRADE